MARRLTLLVLLACASAAAALRDHRRQHSYDLQDSDSMDMDPFVLLDDFDSFETTPAPRARTTKISAKVIVKAKPPKVNVTIKNAKSDTNKKVVNKKDVLKSTTINIHSHTNFIMTKKPGVITEIKPNRVKVPVQTYVAVDDQYDWEEQENLVQVARPSARPRPPARPGPRRPSTSQRPRTTTRRRTTTTTRRPTTRAATHRTSKPKQKKQTTKSVPCPPKNAGWLSNYLQGNKIKKTPNKQQSKSGMIRKVFNWVSKSAWSWFRGRGSKKDPTTTTTTVAPPTTTTSTNWFQSLLDSEENDDGAYAVTEPNKKVKKSLKKNYKGYQLLRAYPDAQWKVHELLDLQEEGQGSGLMWWTVPSLNGSTDLLVPPDLLVDVKDHFKSNKIDFDVVIWDLQKAITYENPRLSKKQRLELEQLRGHPMTWRRYHRYADILRYLEYLQHSHGDLVELIPLGRSSEGLPLVAVKISLPSNNTNAEGKESKRDKKKYQLRSRMKPAVWLEGGVHAREWIAPAVATWMLHTLVEGEKGLGAEHEILELADFYILPVFNPDGYEHSHTHDRLWMKTRSRFADTEDYFTGWFPWNWGRTECVGADPDRNWDYHWGEMDASRDPCDEHYAGPHPFSEPETRAVSEFLAERRGQIKVYLSLHAYSQAWLLPSSHAHAPFADDGVLMEMGKLATTALADLYGTKYQVGTASDIRQPASGMSHDWAKARAGIKYAYHVDLRDSHGPYGFLLPGSQIVSTARETWHAVKAMVDNLHD